MKFSDDNYPIIVFSHLPWDGVWQRPQQFHSRLSQRHRILFVEGPVPVGDRTESLLRVRSLEDYPGVTVAQMEVPGSRWEDGAFIDGERQRLLDSLLNGPLARDFQRPVLWFYDPMAVEAFNPDLKPLAVVYDCMDQLSQFKFCPPELSKREQRLLEMADVVFAGGPKLHKAKSMHNTNCHCFGCGVDADHFGKALQEETPIPADLAGIPRPILGFFGVVDERMDYDLVLRLAEADPDWNLVLIGPPAKVNPDDFPKHPRIHWLGRREYRDLPGYCKGFDVCLLPFAINEATEYINPTKALEYMATGRPIVSSPVEDVVLQFQDIVHVGWTHEEFIEHCRRAVSTPGAQRIRRGLLRARNTTWDAIVRQMENHIREILEEDRAEASSAA